jgi:hypothetical protein
VGLFSGSKLSFIGFASAGGNPTASPPPTATPSAGESPTVSPPTASYVVGGWRWHELDRMPYPGTSVVRVPNGYFGRCGDSMCTSPNGWSWQVPADPAIFATDRAALFSPLSVARRPGGAYVVNAGEGVWYSLDGVHWKPSGAPADSAGFRAVVYGASGFTLVGSPDNAIGGKSRIYNSPDGATWTDLGIGPMVGVLARGGTSGGILDMIDKTSTGPVMAYSADGRTWVPASLPKDQYPSTNPYRLSDGSLVGQGSGAILSSTDGRSWVALKTGWGAVSLAVAGDRIVAVALDTGGGGAAWESTDDGRTFHRLMDGAASVEQFGDLVLLRTSAGGSFVGAPLSASETPGDTPTATGLPASSGVPGYTPPPTPLGGISKEEAIRIAVNATHPPADQAAKASAGVEMDSRYGRWIWFVSFTRYYSGPLNAAGTWVDVDYFTGEVLASGDWIS